MVSSRRLGISVRPRALRAGLAGDRRRILAAQENPEVFLPGADLRVLGTREARVDLAYVIQVVHRPGRQQLPESHLAERWMQTAPVEVGVGDQLAKRG